MADEPILLEQIETILSDEPELVEQARIALADRDANEDLLDLASALDILARVVMWRLRLGGTRCENELAAATWALGVMAFSRETATKRATGSKSC